MTHDIRLKAFEYLQSLMVLECTDFDVWFYFASQLKRDCAEENDLTLYKEVEKYIQERIQTHQE